MRSADETVWNEPALVKRLQQDDELAFGQLYERYHQPVFRFSMAFVHQREEASEIVQNVFLKVWQHRHRIDPTRPLEPYLYTIAKNESLQCLKKIAREALQKKALSSTPAFSPSADHDLIFAEYQALADEAIRTLPPKRQLIFQMFRQEGKSHREIAQAMGVSLPTVRSQLAEATKAVKTYLRRHIDIAFTVLASLLSM